mgnify:CR=1 FL=1
MRLLDVLRNAVDGAQKVASTVARPIAQQTSNTGGYRPTGAGLPAFSRDQQSQRTAGKPVNDTQQPFARALQMPIWKQDANPVAKPLGYRPMDDSTKEYIDQAARSYAWTPEFKDIVARAQPVVTKKLDSSGLVNVPAAGTYSPGNYRPFNQYINNNQISLDPDFATPRVISHEGLHAADFMNENGRKDFAAAYNNSVTPRLKAYLNARTDSYVQGQDFNGAGRFESLNPSMQTEAHSYLGERANLPRGLSDYYKRYLDINAGRQAGQKRANLIQSVNDSLNGYRYRNGRPMSTDF